MENTPRLPASAPQQLSPKDNTMLTSTRRFPQGMNLVWILFAIALTFYALLAMQSGVHNLPSESSANHLQLLNEVEAKGNQNVPYTDVAQPAKEAYPWWNLIMAKVSSTYYGFGSNGATEPLKYYLSMKPNEKSVLSVHMILGGTCVILGIFQFWPGLRKKHRKLHRVTGGAYIVAAYTMLAASVYHLLHTGVENTFQGFTFYLQLWFLVLSTAISQTLAIYFIKKRNFNLHFAFQAYTYSAFLSAPVQRYDWMFFGHIYPHLTQGEVNNLVNILTFWQCLLICYLIFAWNRAVSPVRPGAATPAPSTSPTLTSVLWALGAAAAITTVALYVYAPGLGQWSAARSIVPATTLAAEALLYQGKTLQNILFTIATCTAIVSGLWLLLRDPATRMGRNLFYVAALVSGGMQIAWGWQLGEPNIRVISGGGFYVVSGVSLVAFALIALWFQWRGHANLWRETLVFAVNYSFAPALLLWFHGLWAALGVIPQQYLDIGHGYILAAGGALLTPTINGFIASFTSQETRSRVIS